MPMQVRLSNPLRVELHTIGECTKVESQVPKFDSTFKRELNFLAHSFTLQVCQMPLWNGTVVVNYVEFMWVLVCMAPLHV